MAADVGARTGSTVVRVGCKVKLHGEKGAMEFVIVEPEEADAGAGLVSSESPMGRALVGRVLGQMAKVEAPSGAEMVRIVRIGVPGSEGDV
jgi:transcription elongation factor GreA